MDSTKVPKGRQGFNKEWLDRNELAQDVQTREGKAAFRLQEKKAPQEAANEPAAPEVAQKDMKSQVTQGQRYTQSLAKTETRTEEQVARYQQRLDTLRAKQDELLKGEKRAEDAEVGAPDWITGGGRVTAWGEGGGGGDAFAGKARRGGLVSLDVQLPRRGTRYLFTMPRGEVEITASAASSKVLSALFPLGIVLFALLVVMGVRRARSTGRGFGLETQFTISILLILLGALGMLFWIFPLVGVIALVGGVYWQVRVRRARRKAAAA
jgi:hypothetical protein